MRMAERTKWGMEEDSEGEDFSAGPHVPEGEEVPMVAYDGPKFKEVCVRWASQFRTLFRTYSAARYKVHVLSRDK